MVVDEVLPDRRGVAVPPERVDDQLSIRLALGARPGRGIEAESVDLRGDGRFGRPRSVDTSGGKIAGFALDSLGRPRPRTGIPAAFR
ncbi:MAG TPA: hypothetical protein VGR43_02275 [Dehalococcoidia bacterium]|nr:hypothetical protein [Dehalococcoidia bacterium]